MGKDGASVHAGAIAGASVEAGASTTVGDSHGNAARADAGVSVGAQVGGEVGGGATMNHGVATVGVSGEVALIAGIELNTSVSVDTTPVQQAAVTVAKETTNAANTVSKGVTDTAKKAGNALNPKKWKF